MLNNSLETTFHLRQRSSRNSRDLRCDYYYIHYTSSLSHDHAQAPNHRRHARRSRLLNQDSILEVTHRQHLLSVR